MTTAGADVHSKYVQALRTQNADPLLPNALPCPFVGHEGRIFQTLGQLCDHAKTEHAQEVQDLRPNQVREKMKNLILKQRYLMLNLEFALVLDSSTDRGQEIRFI